MREPGELQMGEFSPIHWLIVIAIIVILFGGRRIPEVMRGMGEGIRSFKEGMRGGDGSSTAAPPSTSNPAPPVNPPPQEQK
jgi:sec-independent protein translocase protein TatA